MTVYMISMKEYTKELGCLSRECMCVRFSCFWELLTAAATGPPPERNYGGTYETNVNNSDEPPPPIYSLSLSHFYLPIVV